MSYSAQLKGWQFKYLDIGSGNYGLINLLLERGYKITAFDIHDKSRFNHITPIIFNGENLPFKTDQFDSTTVITVLHHSSNPVKLIEEAIRVSRKEIIIMEDIYSNYFQKHLTYFTDSVVNWEFALHPHNNKNFEEWRNLFNDYELAINDYRIDQTLLFFRQVIFRLKIKKGAD